MAPPGFWDRALRKSAASSAAAFICSWARRRLDAETGFNPCPGAGLLQLIQSQARDLGRTGSGVDDAKACVFDAQVRTFARERAAR